MCPNWCRFVRYINTPCRTERNTKGLIFLRATMKPSTGQFSKLFIYSFLLLWAFSFISTLDMRNFERL